LKDICSYIAEENPIAVEEVGQQIIERVNRLSEYPQLGRMVPERQDANTREVISRPYRIVYRVKRLPDRIEVLRIWHAARGEPEIEDEHS
jgi:toxin ParE1/3/4